MTDDRITAARRQFAVKLMHMAHVRSPVVVDAFATVPRERFVGTGPWRILSLLDMAYWTTADADARHLYDDVLVAIDEGRGLNNGQPSLWAFLYDQLELAAGMHIVHVGAGTGYYSAILAEIVGRAGQVTAVEIDPALAARARTNLALDWPQVRVVAADGLAFQPEWPADAIIVNAGVSHLSLRWLDALAAENGRLLVPLTNADCLGRFLLIIRRSGATQRYPAQFLCRTRIIPCVGGRPPQVEARLKAAMAQSSFADVRSLRRDPEVPDETCWLVGDGWWLSTMPVAGEGLWKSSL